SVAAEACGTVCRANGDGPPPVVRLPTADSLCDRMERGEEKSHARRRIASQRNHFCRCQARRILTTGSRKFPSGNFRSARDLEVAKRVRRGQASRQPHPSPLARKTVPHASATAAAQPRPLLLATQEC